MSKIPQAVGPYSVAMRSGNLLFMSGQIPLNPETGELVSGDISAQTKQAMANAQAVLASYGLSFDNVVKTTVFLADMNDFVPFNQEYAKSFPNSKPARSCVEVSKLPKGAIVEVECVASFN